MRKRSLPALIAVCALGIFSATASASEAAAPGWEVSPGVYPSTVAPGGTATILLPVYNVGGAASSGPVTVTDRLPAGLTATEAGYYGRNVSTKQFGVLWKCALGATVACVNDPSILASIPPGEMYFVKIVVEASGTVSGPVVNEATVSGGGAPTAASATNTIEFGGETSTFGLEKADSWFSSENGLLDTQAGSHPYSMTVNFFLDNEGERPVGEARNIVVNVPPGLVGNPEAVPRCTRGQLNAELCPADTQIGVDTPALGGPHIGQIVAGGGGLIAPQFPVYNMAPPPGVPAEFGFSLSGVATRLDASVRSGSDYGLSEHVDNITQRDITFNTITIWGAPGESSHNYQRCSRHHESEGTECGLATSIGEVPFLTLPTSCAGVPQLSVTADSWAPLGTLDSGTSELSFSTHSDAGTAVGMTGCDHLSFAPSIEAAPDTHSADAPAGLTVDVKMPQEGLTDPEGFGMSNIKNTTVTLPEGVVINPGQAAGLAVCQPAQSAIGTEGEPSCPAASKVGTDQIETPLLAHKLEGDVYVLQSNPPNLKLLVAASGEGVNLKLVGDVQLNESTGRLTTTFTETPELPFTDFKLSFDGGARAALATPSRCGTYATTSEFTPWSTPEVGDAFPSSSFAIDNGPGGGACPSGPLPFSPTLTAGATTDQAGGYTDFSMLLQRGDGQQRIDGLQFNAPPGLTGELSKVTLCTNAQAESNTCPEASKIGHTVVEAGPGPYPLVVPEAGQPPAPIYLTEKYDGAPFGLSIVVPLHVGPFTLPTQRVRAKIEVNPLTAALTITTNPLPQVVAGVPTDLREVDAVIERPEFMINPTSCDASSFSGTAYGAPPPGASEPVQSAAIASRFQVGSCRGLEFKPTFKASTSARTSRKEGASLHVAIAYPKEAVGTDANLAFAKVELPKALPSELETLKHACLAKVFAANPGGCPQESVVGHAVVHTPVVPVPLEGPAYFVSEGTEWPELIMVLQGYGVTIELVGETHIKNGVTSSTFRSTPDQPFESFALTLPEQEYSALAANGNLCDQKLMMPTYLHGQNGAEVQQKTRIEVRGCPDKLSVVHHKLKAHTLELKVAVPGKGRLEASGKGLAAAKKISTGREPLTVKMRVQGKLLERLRHARGNHKHGMKTKIKLTFSPAKGKKLTKKIKARI